MILKLAEDGLHDWCVAATKREVDRALKRVTLAGGTSAELATSFGHEISKIDPVAIYARRSNALQAAIAGRDAGAVLAVYDNKAILNIVVVLLGLKGRKALEELVGRALRSKAGEPLLEAIKALLPSFVAPVSISSPAEVKDESSALAP